MKVLLDNGLPRSAVAALATFGIEATHVGDIGLADATDAAIIARALADGFIAITLDADFHTRLALTGATRPSVIRIRIEGLRGPAVSLLIANLVRRYAQELVAGAAFSVGPRTTRCHLLPLT